MDTFHFYTPIQVRVGDLDAQGHVNNARFLSYLEQARYAYLVNLELFSGDTFGVFPLILADMHITFAAPIFVTTKVQVGMRVARIGNKSLTCELQIEEQGTGKVLARAGAVVVAYDYAAGRSIRVPDDWRKKIIEFEGLDESPPAS